jgi:hypothetical protein
MNKKTELLHIKIDTDTLEFLRHEALENYRSINNTILMILHAYKQNKEQK